MVSGVSHLDFGSTEVDKDRPQIVWFAKLHLLNQWAAKRGDSFIISHEGIVWLDERGYVVPANQKVVRRPKGSNEVPKTDVPKVEKPDKDPLPHPSEIQPHKYYSTSQAARFLGMNQKYLQNELIPNKQLAAQKRGTRLYILGEDILKYFRQYGSDSETI